MVLYSYILYIYVCVCVKADLQINITQKVNIPGLAWSPEDDFPSGNAAFLGVGSSKLGDDNPWCFEMHTWKFWKCGAHQRRTKTLAISPFGQYPAGQYPITRLDYQRVIQHSPAISKPRSKATASCSHSNFSRGLSRIWFVPLHSPYLGNRMAWGWWIPVSPWIRASWSYSNWFGESNDTAAIRWVTGEFAQPRFSVKWTCE